MTYKTAFKIGNRDISIDAPTYFIADIAANHDGDLERAKAARGVLPEETRRLLAEDES